jgi:hypothetical protein
VLKHIERRAVATLTIFNPLFSEMATPPRKAVPVILNLASTTPSAAVALVPLLTFFRVVRFAHATTPAPTSSFSLRRVGLLGYSDEHGRRSSTEN